MSASDLLTIKDLSISFTTRHGLVRALEKVNFDIQKGETVAVVGESGSGKSVTANAILRILEQTAQVPSGEIIFSGMNLLTMRERDLLDIRGREVAMIFQNPRAALNPIRSIGKQIEDVLRIHGPMTKAEARVKTIEALKLVNITDPEHRYHQYPFELSGGMCQRVMIALAISCKPALLIADEPTTGLDVTTQANIMALIKTRSQALNMATMLITHDLNMAAQYSDRIVVMHAGQVVESASTEALYQNPMHPYTQKLIAATPSFNTTLQDIQSIPGSLPNLIQPTPSCRFAGRCEQVVAECYDRALDFVPAGEKHWVACWKVESYAIA